MSCWLSASVRALIVALAVLSAAPRTTVAQEAEGEEEPAGDAFATTGQSAVAPAWQEHESWHIDQRVRSSRIALIVTSVAVPVGAGLYLGGAALCVIDGIFQGECTPGEKAALGIGGALFLGGLVGVVVSGAMLGVAKKRRRQLRQANFKLRWDARAGAFVF